MNIFKKKIVIKKNKPKDIIVFDDTYLNLNLHFSYEKINFNELNFYYALKTILLFFKKFNNFTLSESYKKILYESFKPKIAIGNNLSLKTFECKYLCPNITTITYQFSWVNGTGSGGFDPKKPSLIKRNKTDYFLILHKNEARILKKYFDATFIVSGSVRNNSINLKKKKKPNNFITYISDYEKQPAPVKQKKNFEKFILEVLSEFCKKYKKKLVIALKCNRKDKVISCQSELNYYKNLSKNFYTYKSSSYKIVNDSILSVSLSSSLGLEMLSRGSKVLFLPYLNKISKKIFCQYTNKKNLPFIHDNFHKRKIFLKLKYLMNLKENSWKNQINKFNLKIHFDKNNKILNKICSKIILNR